jgi:hypothetical protein
MNRTLCRSSRAFLRYVLTGAFIVAGELPMLAAAQQQSTPASTSIQLADDSLPDAPQSQTTTTQDQSTSVPSGAAGAKAANPKGAPAAQPVGAAVAPVRQRNHRSLLIKVGLIVGAGIAVGTAIALTAGSPSRPPGAMAAAAH